MTPRYDAVVAGAGLAGLTAAVTLAEHDLDVLLLEKQAEVGGSTVMSGGWFAWSDTEDQHRLGIADSDAIFLEDLRRTGGGHADESLLHAYVELQREADHWSRSRLDTTYDVVKLSAGQSVPRSHHADIRPMMGRLLDLAAASPRVHLQTDTAVTRLERNDAGTVAGVEANGPSGRTRHDGLAGVVLATGGFSRSRDLLTLFAPAQLAAIPHGGLGSTGDGLRLGWRLGADLRDVGWVSGTFGSHPDTTDDEHELLTAFYLGAIIVNRDGQRFVDESLTYKEIGQACLGQPGGLGFEVFDQRVRDRSQPGVPLSDIGYLQDKGHVLQAPTLAALAQEVGIEPDGLAGTVARYNAAIGSREDDQGRDSLCNGVGALDPIDVAPFYGYPARTLMTSTYGGLRVTPSTEVLDVDGEVIAGLHAVGEVSGGFHGASYLTGTALGKALVFGRRAAHQIATAP
ncbi:FAD-dependent oxidoreductase [Angustibacter luteus]|uniref:FAD-dependent oxidoreductase n=1 Tax=Angustibacter luteus TaxID=658456 RepID=A0ABW1JG49_9ACTN